MEVNYREFARHPGKYIGVGRDVVLRRGNGERYLITVIKLKEKDDQDKRVEGRG